MQAKVRLISEKCADYGKKVHDALLAAGVRAELDDRNEKIGYMIREAQVVGRIPYMVIVGQKEAEEGTVSVRNRDTAETVTYPMEEFVAKIARQIKDRT